MSLFLHRITHLFRRDKPARTTPTQNRSYDLSSLNALRENILGYDAQLTTAVATANHEQFEQLMTHFIAELTRYNTSICVSIVTPIEENHSEHNKAVSVLWLQHNATFIEIRSLCKELLDAKPLLKTSDPHATTPALAKHDYNLVFAKLQNIKLKLEDLEYLWTQLRAFENLLKVTCAFACNSRLKLR